MAVQMPTITVTDAQGAFILDAYQAHFGTSTTQETVDAYKRWLVQSIIDVVIAHKARELDEEANAYKREQLEQFVSALPSVEELVT